MGQSTRSSIPVGRRPTLTDIHDTFHDTMKITTKRTATIIALTAVGALASGTARTAFADAGGARAERSNESVNAAARPVASAERPTVEVWKAPTCGCCRGWVDYLEDEGFEVVAHDVDDVDPIRAELGLTDARLKSCHTASVGGYVVEGHVPVSDIERLLAERPDVVGISAPGMPMMSPGMGSTEPKGYDVVSFAENGEVTVFASH